MAAAVKIREVRLARFDLQTRMPFRYGIATMTRLPHVWLSVRLDSDGAADGFAGDHLPPKWFRKDPDQTVDDEIEEMLSVIRRAARAAMEIEAPDVFSFWLALHRDQRAWADRNGIPPLLAHFGTSLVERALIDAFCARRSLPFSDAVLGNDLGIRLETLDGALSSRSPGDFLRPPEGNLFVRHTVGLADPIDESDIGAGEELEDGLPQSLEAVIRRYGTSHFKIKINADWDHDRERLERVFRRIDKEAPASWRFSLDGNESFQDAEAFRAYWERLAAVEPFRKALDRLLFVEQPVARARALEAASDWTRWKDAPPILIDESDGDLEDLPRALELGYRGTSHKNCKGVFRGILNRCRIAIRRDPRLMTSAEDLANIAPLALNQDLIVQDLLSNQSVERNGHHYFNGLSMWPGELQDALLRSHPDLFERGAAGSVRLAVRQGRMDTRSLLGTPFGLDEEVRQVIDRFLDRHRIPVEA